MADLAPQEPQNLLEFMDKVDEYINHEETLRAMIDSGKAQVLGPKNLTKLKKNPQAKQATEAKPHKQFKDYNFMPLNASIHEVLTEVKKDPDYSLPQKIMRATGEKQGQILCLP